MQTEVAARVTTLRRQEDKRRFVVVANGFEKRTQRHDRKRIANVCNAFWDGDISAAEFGTKLEDPVAHIEELKRSQQQTLGFIIDSPSFKRSESEARYNAAIRLCEEALEAYKRQQVNNAVPNAKASGTI